MNFKNYTENCYRTWKNFSFKESITNAFLGLQGELFEISELNSKNSREDFISEIGDYFYYLTILKNEFVFKEEDIILISSVVADYEGDFKCLLDFNTKLLFFIFAKFSEIIKKIVFHEKSMNKYQKEIKEFLTQASYVGYQVICVKLFDFAVNEYNEEKYLEFIKNTLENEIYEYNVKKLENRYPKGFDPKRK